MSELDKLLAGHAPPPVPSGLAARAVAEAVRHDQELARLSLAARRRDRRGGWRPLWIGTASFGLAFTSAVAATVASGGRIEIPVIKQVVAAIPILAIQPEPEKVVERTARVEPKPIKHVVPEPPSGQMNAAAAQGDRLPHLMQKFAESKQRVEARRAAGLPTPRADRIEAQARHIVERRQAAWLPTPPVEQVEAGLALREVRRARMQGAGAYPNGQLIARLIERLPPDKRASFEQLSPEQQRQLIQRWFERRHARRQMVAGGEGSFETGGEGFVEPPH